MDRATYGSDGRLLKALLNSVVDGRTRVAVHSGRAALARLVDIDGEEGLAGALERLPGGSDRLAAVLPGAIARLNAARVELELGTLENLVLVGGATTVGLVKLQDVGAVDEGGADVTTGGATIKVVLGDDLGEVVHDATKLLDARGKGSESDVTDDGAVIGLARVILDLLKEHEVGSEHLLDDLGGNALHVGRVRVQVAGVVVGDGDAAARLLRLEGDGRVISGGVLEGSDGSKGQDAVEAEGVVDETGDVAEIVAHLGVVGVLGPVSRGSNDDGLGVGVYSEERLVSLELGARG